jgi:ABC-2 type transport system permease protein
MASFSHGTTGEVRDTYLSVGFELRKHLRRRRLLIVVALAILMPLVFNIVPLIGDVEYADFPDTFASAVLQFVGVLIVISAALFAGDAVSGEFEKKTGLLLFPTTQSRTSIFVGKYIAALLATFLVVSIYYSVTTVQTAVIYGFGNIPAEMVRSYALALLYSTSAVSVVFFFSSIMKRTISSTVLGFVVLLMVFPILETVLGLVDIEPWFVLSYSAGLLTNVIGGTVGFGPPEGHFALPTFAPDLDVGIAVMAAYTLVFFAGSIACANRKSLE